MKKIKMKVITSCLSLGLVAITLFTPISAFAGTIGDPTTQLDGRLSTFHQGAANDCGAVSGIQALANSKFGKKFLSKVISVNSNGSYTLNFGSGKQTVSEKIGRAHV